MIFHTSCVNADLCSRTIFYRHLPYGFQFFIRNFVIFEFNPEQLFDCQEFQWRWILNEISTQSQPLNQFQIYKWQAIQLLNQIVIEWNYLDILKVYGR